MSLSDYSPTVTPAVVFKDRPEWPVYEAPALWYIQRGERSDSRPAK